MTKNDLYFKLFSYGSPFWRVRNMYYSVCGPVCMGKSTLEVHKLGLRRFVGSVDKVVGVDGSWAKRKLYGQNQRD